MAARNDVAAVVPIYEKREVVPIHYNELRITQYYSDTDRKV